MNEKRRASEEEPGTVVQIGTRSEGERSFTVKRVSKNLGHCAQKERTRRQQPNKKGQKGEVGGEPPTSTLLTSATTLLRATPAPRRSSTLRTFSCFEVMVCRAPWVELANSRRRGLYKSCVCGRKGQFRPACRGMNATKYRN